MLCVENRTLKQGLFKIIILFWCLLHTSVKNALFFLSIASYQCCHAVSVGNWNVQFFRCRLLSSHSVASGSFHRQHRRPPVSPESRCKLLLCIYLPATFSNCTVGEKIPGSKIKGHLSFLTKHKTL